MPLPPARPNIPDIGAEKMRRTMSLFAGGDAWIKKWLGGNTATRPF